MTYAQFYIRRKSPKNKGFVRVLIFCLLGILGVVIVFAFFAKNSNNKMFDAIEFFYVSIEKTNNKNNVSALQKKVKNLGGAGYAFEDDGVFYVIAGCYATKQEASVVVNQVSSQYNAQILSRNTEKVKRNISEKIKSKSCFGFAFGYLKEQCVEFFDNVKQFLSGEKTSGDIYLCIQKSIISCENHKQKLISVETKKQDEIKIQEQLVLSIMSFNNILSQATSQLYAFGETESVLRLCSVRLVEVLISLCENLNKI